MYSYGKISLPSVKIFFLNDYFYSSSQKTIHYASHPAVYQQLYISGIQLIAEALFFIYSVLLPHTCSVKPETLGQSHPSHSLPPPLLPLAPLPLDQKPSSCPSHCYGLCALLAFLPGRARQFPPWAFSYRQTIPFIAARTIFLKCKSGLVNLDLKVPQRLSTASFLTPTP